MKSISTGNRQFTKVITADISGRQMGWRIGLLLAVGCMILLSTPVMALSTATISQEGITSTDIDDIDVVTSIGQTPYVWQSEAYSVSVTVADYPDDAADNRFEYDVVAKDSDGAELDLKNINLGGGETQTVRLDIPAETHLGTGVHEVTIEMWEVELLGNDKMDSQTLRVGVLRQSGDRDNDNLENQREVQSGLDLTDADSDDDGLPDGMEVHRHQTDAAMADTDGDGLDDGQEVNRHSTDPRSTDTDSDGLSDATEVQETNTDPTVADTDGDGIDDGVEVTDYGTNPLQTDTDGDGLADNEELFEQKTDPLESDTDGDGIEDGTEVDQNTNPTNAASPGSTATASETTGQSSKTPPASTTMESPDGRSKTTVGSAPETERAVTEAPQTDQRVQRGLFVNGPDSILSQFTDAALITVVGFVLSITGIVLQLWRGA